MFALPDAKRVRRSDLFSAHSRSASPASSTRSASSSPDPEAAAAILRARLDAQLGAAPVIASPVANESAAHSNPDTNDNAQNGGDEDDEVEFRLFAAPSKLTATPAPQQQESSTAKSQPAVQKIRLRSPSLDPDRPAGFVNPSRPRSYYFAPAADSSEATEQRAAYAATAVSGADILKRAASIRWPGCAVPWKVSVLDPASGKLRRACVRHGEPAAGDGIDADGGDEKKGGKRRKSKKARVALRKKRAAGLERKEAAERAAKEKEEAEKAKRQEKNRKQKLKRREKERARKAAERGEGGAAGAAGEQDGGEKDEDVVMGEDED